VEEKRTSLARARKYVTPKPTFRLKISWGGPEAGKKKGRHHVFVCVLGGEEGDKNKLGIDQGDTGWRLGLGKTKTMWGKNKKINFWKRRP